MTNVNSVKIHFFKQTYIIYEKRSWKNLKRYVASESKPIEVEETGSHNTVIFRTPVTSKMELFVTFLNG